MGIYKRFCATIGAIKEIFKRGKIEKPKKLLEQRPQTLKPQFVPKIRDLSKLPQNDRQRQKKKSRRLMGNYSRAVNNRKRRKRKNTHKARPNSDSDQLIMAS